MRKIAVQQIEDDMVLTQPIIGLDGKILLQSGSKLKKSLIHRLVGWGVQSAYIDDGNQSEGKQKTNDDKRLARLDLIFKEHLENHKMLVLYQAVQTHLKGGKQ